MNPNCPICGNEMFVTRDGKRAICSHYEPQDPGSRSSGHCSGQLVKGTCGTCGESDTWVMAPYFDAENGPSPRDLDPTECSRCMKDAAEFFYGVIEISCQTPGCRWGLDDDNIARTMVESTTPDGIMYCPNCKVDESGLEFTRVGDIKIAYEVFIDFPKGMVKLPGHWLNGCFTPQRTLEAVEGLAQADLLSRIEPVEFQLRWIPDPEPGSGRCKHGVYVGGIGIDWMCGQCENATGTRWDDVEWVRR